MAREPQFGGSFGLPTKRWRRDLLDHLAYLVMYNEELPRPEDEVRAELQREFSPFLNDDEPFGRRSS